MPFSSGDPNAFVAVGMQSALGTPQVTATKLRFIKYLSGTDAGAEVQVQDVREGGDGLDHGLTYKTLEGARGQLVINGRPEAAGQLLQMLPGGATWDGASAPAAHTFNSGHASFPWATLLVQHPGSAIAQLMSDVRFTSITVEGGGGQPWKVTLPFIAIQHGASFAAVTPTYYGDAPFYYYSNPTYVVDGTVDTDVTAFKITHSLGVDENVQSQGLSRDEIPVMNRDTDVEITRRFENQGLWAKIYYGASGNVAATTSVATGSFVAGVGYGAAAALRALQLNVPLLSYRANTLTQLDPDGKTVYETIVAKGLKAATHAFWATLQNAHASAYAS